MKARALELNKLENPMVFWGLVFALVLFASLYAYLVNQTVWNVVARQKAEKSLTSLNSSTSQLESTYMAMKGGIDMTLAKSLGFNAAPNTKYINRTTLGQLPHPVE